MTVELIVENGADALNKAMLCPHSKVYVAHGCNLKGRMSGGAARAIADRYPEVERLDMALSEQYKINTGLSYCPLPKRDEVEGVFNLYTQHHPGAGSLEYKWIAQNVGRMLTYIREYHDPSAPSIFLPLIGSGIAGGDPTTCLLAIKLGLQLFTRLPNAAEMYPNLFVITWSDDGIDEWVKGEVSIDEWGAHLEAKAKEADESCPYTSFTNMKRLESTNG